MDDLCEVCGNRPAKKIVEIEGAKVRACNTCARHGKVLFSTEYRKGETRRFNLHIKPEEEIVENYSELIRTNRQKKGLSREELAKALNEKVSYLEHIERGEMKPTIKLAKKLEKFLNIKLIEKEVPDTSGIHDYGPKDRGYSLMDALIVEKKKRRG